LGLAEKLSSFTIVIRKSVQSVNPYKIGMPGFIRTDTWEIFLLWHDNCFFKIKK